MSVAPSVNKLDNELDDLTEWKRFGKHLRGIEAHHITAIEQKRRNNVAKCKLALYETWLKACPSATWSDVVRALKFAKQQKLARRIQQSYSHQIASDPGLTWQSDSDPGLTWESASYPVQWHASGIESQLAFYNRKEAVNAAVDAALAEGGGNLFQYNLVFHGPPGAGKSSLKRVMLGQDPLATEEQTSTDIVENAVRTVTTHRAKIIAKEFTVIGNDEMISMLAEEVNDHHDSTRKEIVDESSIYYSSSSTPGPSTMPAGVLSYPTYPLPICARLPAVSSAVLSIRERLDRATGPVKIYDSTWHHLVDSGGQPQFMDILPLVYHSPSLNVVVVRLTESLDDKPSVCFYEGSYKYFLPHRLLLSNRELIINMCQIAASCYASGGVVPYVMVVGTHLDWLGEVGRVLREFNQGLAEVKKNFGHVLICKSEDEVIFPINTMATGGERKQYTKELQECITTVTKQHMSPIEVPLRWLVYQLDLDKEGGVVRMGDCYKSGETLGMNKDDVKSALRFFKDKALIMYFPDDIPDLVLTKMDPLIGRLSKLVKSSFIPPMFHPPAESERLRTKGLFHMSYLPKVLSNIKSNDLSDEEFVTILQCLKIAVCVADKEYFLPSALSLEPIGEQSTFEMSSVPLVFSWGERFLPHGFFFTIAVELLGRDGDYKFELRTDIAQWRQEIQVREATGKIAGVVKLTNRMKWIQVSSSSINIEEDCPAIYKEVNIAVQKSISRFQHTGIGPPVVTSLCPLCVSRDHYCLLSAKKKVMTCDANNSKTGPVSQEMFCWFQDTNTLPINTTSTATSHKPSYTPQLLDVHRLLRCKSSEWLAIGRELGVDYSYRKSLERESGRTDEAKLEDVLARWIERQCSEVSWDNLIQVLKDQLHFVDLAREVKRYLETDHVAICKYNY